MCYDGAMKTAALMASMLLVACAGGARVVRYEPTQFTHFDLDGNGTLSRSELLTGFRVEFDVLDNNADQQIASGELTGSDVPSVVRAGAAEGDTDGDGVLSATEYAAYRISEAMKFDTDGDGELSEVEFDGIVADPSHKSYLQED